MQNRLYFEYTETALITMIGAVPFFSLIGRGIFFAKPLDKV